MLSIFEFLSDARRSKAASLSVGQTVIEVYLIIWIDTASLLSNHQRANARVRLLEPAARLFENTRSSTAVWYDYLGSLQAVAKINAWRVSDLSSAVCQEVVWLQNGIGIYVKDVILTGDGELLCHEAGVAGGSTECRCHQCLAPMAVLPYAPACGEQRTLAATREANEQLSSAISAAPRHIEMLTGRPCTQQALQRFIPVLNKLSGNSVRVPLLVQNASYLER